MDNTTPYRYWTFHVLCAVTIQHPIIHLPHIISQLFIVMHLLFFIVFPSSITLFGELRFECTLCIALIICTCDYFY